MALSSEQLKLQADILASKTDSKTNPNMAYKAVEAMNKGLNPEYFSSNKTKIVNAINSLAGQNKEVENLVSNIGKKVNDVLLDSSSIEGQTIWEETKKVLGKKTVVEGLKFMLEGNKQKELLSLKAEDVGKVLSISQDEAGNLFTEAIEVTGGGAVGDVTAENVAYTNESQPEITTVAQAIDFLFKNGAANGPITWDDIQDKPQLADSMVLTSEALTLKSGEGDLSTIPIVGVEDIENIFSSMTL